MVRQIHTQLSKLIDCASLNSGSEPISDEPLYETLVSTIKLKYPETTLEGDEKHNPFTIEGSYELDFVIFMCQYLFVSILIRSTATYTDLIREFESIKNSDIQLTHALSPLFCLLHEAMVCIYHLS